MCQNLMQVALGAGHDSGKLQLHVLGLHVEDERVREALGLAGLNGVVVLHGSQVAKDALVGGGVLGELLGIGDGAGQEGDLNGTILVVCNFNESLCRAAVDEAHAQDVGVGEGRLQVGLELGLRRGDAAVCGGGGGRSISLARLSRVRVRMSLMEIDGERGNSSCSLERNQ